MLRKKQRLNINSEINVVPLTDVMLVLLIIFMVTTPFIMQGNIKINLPEASAPSDDLAEKEIVVGISDDGRMFLNGVEMSDMPGLENEIKRMIEATGNRRVIIEGDRMAFHGTVVRVMGAAKNAGADGIAVSTIPEDMTGR
ncbi:MAG TPA: biopolymer transporter ExbD [Firmicutes bacterium]|nr:biopolymer transporter ExbD [Bacillota bacterium]